MGKPESGVVSRRTLLFTGAGVSLATTFGLGGCGIANASTSLSAQATANARTIDVHAASATNPTAADYAMLRGKWSVMQTGKGNYSPAASPYAAYLSAIDAEAQGWYSTLNTTPGSGGSLWTDTLAGTAEVNTRVSFDRLRILAIAYATDGSTYENDAALLSAISTSLQWLSTNRYNTTITKSGNWWEWEIGMPLSLLDTVIILRSALADTLVNALMTAIDRFTYDPTRQGDDGTAGNNGTTAEAANRVWKAQIVLIRAIVVEDATKFNSGLSALSSTFGDVTSGDGFYADGSFIQHTGLAYTGGYGMSFLQRAALVLYLLDGTNQAQTTDSWATLRNRVYTAFEPTLYRGGMLDCTMGRTISRSYAQDLAIGEQVAATVTLLAQISPPTDAAAFKSMVKYWIAAHTATRSVFTYDPLSPISLDAIRLMQVIKDDSTITSRGERLGNYQFQAMDRVVHKRSNFAFVVAMYSNFIENYESINNENLHGFYTGSGMTYIYNSDTGAYQSDFWPTVDPYRLPGTTIDKRSLADSAMHDQKGKSPVGGAAIGQSGVTGMYLNAYSGDLVCKKTWFMFGDYILCAGTRITDTSTNAVETIVENRNVGDALGGANDVVFNSTTNKVLLTMGTTETLSSASWINIAGVGGYVFLPGANPILKGLRERRSGTWAEINDRASSPTDTRTRTYVTLWLDHGTSPVQQTYAYVLLPGATASATAAYAAAPVITLSENSGSAQYAHGTFSGSTVHGAVFWNDASYSSGLMTANTSVFVFLRQTATAIDIALADPTEARTASIVVTVNIANSSVHAADPSITVTRTATSATLTLNPTGAKGQSKTVTLNP